LQKRTTQLAGEAKSLAERKLEEYRKEKERLEQERLEKERQEQLGLEAERIARERIERERLENLRTSYKTKLTDFRSKGYNVAPLERVLNSDIGTIERAFNFFEQNLQRVAAVNNELNSLDTHGFESEVAALKSKLNDPYRIQEIWQELSNLKTKLQHRRLVEQNIVLAKTAIHYHRANVIYKVKIENNTSIAISDIRVRPYISENIFKIDKDEKDITLLKPHESSTVTFVLKPKGECGNVDIFGNVSYYDQKTNDYKELKIEPKTTNIVCPLLTVKPIDENGWFEAVGRLIKAEETTEEIPMGAENLFKILSDTVRYLNLYMLKPDITKDGKMFRGVARFYGEGKLKQNPYAAKLEVMGSASKSRMLLSTFAEREDMLIGFHHGIIDELEKRTSVKGYITEAPLIVHGDYVAGDKTDIRDSVVTKSKIGMAKEGGDHCPHCHEAIEAWWNLCPKCERRLKL
jgi:hypothetical protein